MLHQLNGFVGKSETRLFNTRKVFNFFFVQFCAPFTSWIALFSCYSELNEQMKQTQMHDESICRFVKPYYFSDLQLSRDEIFWFWFFTSLESQAPRWGNFPSNYFSQCSSDSWTSHQAHDFHPTRSDHHFIRSVLTFSRTWKSTLFRHRKNLCLVYF